MGVSTASRDMQTAYLEFRSIFKVALHEIHDTFGKILDDSLKSARCQIWGQSRRTWLISV